MKKVILFSLMLVSFVGFSQVEDENKNTKTEIVQDVIVEPARYSEDEPARYPEGERAFNMFIAQNYNIPREAVEMGINGTVVVEFVVEKDGSLTDVKVIRDLGFGTGTEAIRVVKRSKKWIPAKQNGELTRVKFTQPIRVVTEY